MAVWVVVGAQWGDEAKGKVVDFLAANADYVVRYAGGNNAGHTVCVQGQLFKFHTVPSGILHPQVTPVIADGVVIDPKSLLEELRMLQAHRLDTGRLLIGLGAHLILTYHRLLDELEESQRGRAQLGTTKRGIGPTYADKAARIGLRLSDLLEPDRFRQRLQKVLEYKNAILTRVYRGTPLQLDALLEEYLSIGEQLRPHAVHVPSVLSQAVAENRMIILEGAQGTLLDLDYGTYPYVTSSHPVSAGACLGTGIGPKQLDEIWGVTKAYTTRVGEGPFPTELRDERGEYMRERGQEYGTTTGRARRCGWLDLVALRYAAQVNSLTALAVTRLDVLSGLDQLQVCTAYRIGDQETTLLNPEALAECQPVYRNLPGWQEEITHARRRDELPASAQAYLQLIERFVEVPIRLISVGPEREQTILDKPAT